MSVQRAYRGPRNEFLWRCSNGHGGNTNAHHFCIACEEPISCDTAGGHYYESGATKCKDCGKRK